MCCKPKDLPPHEIKPADEVIMSTRPFAGLKVIEYGEYISAPYCTRLLAGLGAEVIKVEKPVTGALCVAAGVGLLCDHLGVTGWHAHAIPLLIGFGCLILVMPRKNSN